MTMACDLPTGSAEQPADLLVPHSDNAFKCQGAGRSDARRSPVAVTGRLGVCGAIDNRFNLPQPG